MMSDLRVSTELLPASSADSEAISELTGLFKILVLASISSNKISLISPLH